MKFPPIYELGPVTVEDGGLAGKERVVFRPTDTINLAQCALIVGIRGSDGIIYPQLDEFFWFGNLVLTPPSWVVIYTGKGNPHTGTHGGNPVHFGYWGREITVFNIQEATPLLIKFSNIQFGGHTRSDIPTAEEVMKRFPQLPAPRA